MAQPPGTDGGKGRAASAHAYMYVGCAVERRIGVGRSFPLGELVLCFDDRDEDERPDYHCME